MAIETSTIRAAGPAATGAAAIRGTAAARAPQAGPRTPRAGETPAAARAPVPLKRGVSGWNSSAQDEIARAQQAMDYLDRVAGQLETLKGELAARLSGARGDERQLEARVRQLAATLDARQGSAGGGVDANLDFNGGRPATQRFRIRGLDMDALQAAGAQSLAFSIGGAGGPQLSVTLEEGMSRKQVAQRFERALAPLNVHAELDGRGQLVFSTDEANWPGVRDSIAISGRGRVATEEEPPALEAQGIGRGNADALRQSLRDVVQALARVRRSQDAAGAALRDATARAAQATAAAQAADAAKMAEHFATTATSPDYDSLLAITSALVGVSRERVLALLNLR